MDPKAKNRDAEGIPINVWLATPILQPVQNWERDNQIPEPPDVEEEEVKEDE